MVLNAILKHKQKVNQALRRSLPRLLKRHRHGHRPRKNVFLKALTSRKSVRLICELKKASPSHGILRKSFKPLNLVKQFESAGASAVSVLTEDRYFGGNPDLLRAVRAQTRLPILRKDFIVDPIQIFESVLLGADAILLIASILPPATLKKFCRLAVWFGLDVVVEIHSPKELKAALASGAKIIGINNRNLKTLAINPAFATKIVGKIPKDRVIVVESGIETRRDILNYQQLGVRNFLIGASIMRAPNVRNKILELLGKRSAHAKS